MEIKFDSNQTYQLEAIAAVVDVFDGMPPAQGVFETAFGPAPGELLTEDGVANRLDLTPEALAKNIAAVQERNGVTPTAVGSEGDVRIFPPLLPGASAYSAREVPQLSLEMETGTGKTYVYLRTLFELNARYGLKKFVIVVPSVAFREGVLQTLRQTEGHFRALYNGVPVHASVYDSKQANRLRQFAVSNQIQILVTNIQAFATDTTIMRQENDKLSGRRPLDFLQSTRPIVILDEPQNLGSDNSRRAIADLNPLCILRYSATHKNPINPLYRLDPVKAYNLGLVKQIQVTSVTDGNPDFNRPHIKVTNIAATSKAVSAKIEIDVAGASGPLRKTLTVKIQKNDDVIDLYALSGEREIYRDGYVIEDIRSDSRKVVFANGHEVYEGGSHGGDGDARMREMVRQTVLAHLEKEQEVARRPDGQRMKILSLFFIDRVANYAEDDGKIRRAFIETYATLAAAPQYAGLNLPPVGKVHDGYFATDKGKAKDTSGTTKADNDAYELIMKDKERLLSRDEPLRFIFSHSALSEGWDNPNVFQICTLNELQSVTRKRQQIGRGLRLPVMENGERCFEENVNRLTVIANESFKEFAAQLQKEIQDETGADFTGKIKNARERRLAHLRPGWLDNPYFAGLWERICQKTRYQVEYDTAILIANAAAELKKSPRIDPPQFRIETLALQLSDEGVTGALTGRVKEATVRQETPLRLPDILGHLQAATELTRPTLGAILRQSGRLPEIFANPQQLLDQAIAAIVRARDALLISGVKYQKWAGHVYEMRLFEENEIKGYRERMIEVQHGLYDVVEFDSAPEEEFARFLDHVPDVKLFLKLPRWFKIETPLGNYNPDWAIVVESDGKDRLYCVRETKGTGDWAKLAVTERDKITCGKRHFASLGVDYEHQSGYDKSLHLNE